MRKISRNIIIGFLLIIVLILSFPLTRFMLLLMIYSAPDDIHNLLSLKQIISVSPKEAKIYNLSQIESTHKVFYPSNARDKIAYVDSDRNLVIFDLTTKKQIKVYKFNHVVSSLKLLWSPDDRNILFADPAQLFTYDTLLGLITKQTDSVFTTDCLSFYQMSRYNWVDSKTIIYYSVADSTHKYLIKNIDNEDPGSIKELSSYGIPSSLLNADYDLTGNPDIDSNFTAAGSGEHNIIVYVNRALGQTYEVSVKPGKYGKNKIIILEINSALNALKLINNIMQDQSLTCFSHKEKLKSDIELCLRRFLSILPYANGHIDFYEYKGEESFDKTKSVMQFKDGQLDEGRTSSILISDFITDNSQLVFIPSVHFDRTNHYKKQFYWVSNNSVLFESRNTFSPKSDAVYKLNIATKEIQKYPNRFAPESFFSADGSKLMLEYLSGRFSTLGGERYRYDNLMMYDNNRKEKPFFKIHCDRGEIVKCFWGKDAKTFYFITSIGGSYHSWGRACKFNIWVIKFK